MVRIRAEITEYCTYEYDSTPTRLLPDFGCFYCGESSYITDYCPPLRWRFAYRSERDARGRSSPLRTVPACRECGDVLRDQPLYDFRTRAEFIAKRLEGLHERRPTLWDDDELAQMGPALQPMIAGRQVSMRILADRIRHAQWRAAAESDRYE